jgi:hypothetical protein
MVGGRHTTFELAHGEAHPLIVVVPLERSVLARCGDVADTLWKEWVDA